MVVLLTRLVAGVYNIAIENLTVQDITLPLGAPLPGGVPHGCTSCLPCYVHAL